METVIRNLKSVAQQLGRKTVVFLISLFLLGIFSLKAQEMTEKEKGGYAVGVMLGEKIKSSGKELSFIKALEEDGFFDALRQGLHDDLNGKSKLSKEELQSTLKALKEKVDAMKKQENESEKQENESPVNYQHLLAQHYSSLSWYYLFTKDYAQSEQSARKALELDSTYLATKTNLAHSLLFQNHFSDAEAIYKELSQAIYQDNETYTQTLLNDFDELEKAGAIHEEHKTDVEKIRQMLAGTKK